MQAIQKLAEQRSWWRGSLCWSAHNGVWLGLIVLAFFIGMGVNNNEATDSAVSSVQDTYRGKLGYHIQHEKVLAKTVQKVEDACEKNANAAINNEALPQDVRGCPPVPMIPDSP